MPIKKPGFPSFKMANYVSVIDTDGAAYGEVHTHVVLCDHCKYQYIAEVGKPIPCPNCGHTGGLVVSGLHTGSQAWPTFEPSGVCPGCGGPKFNDFDYTCDTCKYQHGLYGGSQQYTPYCGMCGNPKAHWNNKYGHVCGNCEHLMSNPKLVMHPGVLEEVAKYTPMRMVFRMNEQGLFEGLYDLGANWADYLFCTHRVVIWPGDDGTGGSPASVAANKTGGFLVDPFDPECPVMVSWVGFADQVTSQSNYRRYFSINNDLTYPQYMIDKPPSGT
jgi:hypothetical protein